MRVPARRIGLALVFTALAATAIVLRLEHRRIAPAAVMVETSYAKIVPSEVDRDPADWYPMVGDNSN